MPVSVFIALSNSTFNRAAAALAFYKSLSSPKSLFLKAEVFTSLVKEFCKSYNCYFAELVSAVKARLTTYSLFKPFAIDITPFSLVVFILRKTKKSPENNHIFSGDYSYLILK
mgnify:CR=1 FL=1